MLLRWIFLESLSQNTKTSFIFYHLGSCSIDWRSVFVFTLNLGLPWKINYTRLSAQSKEESIDILFNFLLLQEQDVDWLNSVWLLNLVDLNNKVITYGEFQMHWLVILIMQCLGTRKVLQMNDVYVYYCESLVFVRWWWLVSDMFKHYSYSYFELSRYIL